MSLWKTILQTGTQTQTQVSRFHKVRLIKEETIKTLRGEIKNVQFIWRPICLFTIPKGRGENREIK